jgi:glycerate kinase
MKILIAPDKFKSGLSAFEVAECIDRALKLPGIETEICPLADGGEGTGRILTKLCGGKIFTAKVSDPLMQSVEASFGLSPDGKTAFIEMSQASGLWRLNKATYDPGRTTTYGTGELILRALESGASEVVLGCGGSATNDGGAGMAAALGWKFFNDSGADFIPTGFTLKDIRSISDEKVHPLVKAAGFTVISDVTNPLTGPQGAAYTFGPQKGADAEMVIRLDEGLIHFVSLIARMAGKSFDSVAGAGAGGGMGAGAMFFLNAKPERGIDYIIRASDLERKVLDADLIITGEGKLDHQSLHGKVVSGIAELSQKHQKPFWVVCGVNALGNDALSRLGAERVISLTEVAGSPEESVSRPAFWTEKAVSMVFQ